MSAVRVIVIGGDAAGMSTASQALRAARSVGREVQVLVLEATAHTSYSACGLPYWIAGEVDSGEDLVARTADEHRAAGIDLRLNTRATAVDLAARTVTARGPAGEETWHYDELVLATGATPVVPPAFCDQAGNPLPGIAPVTTLDQARWWLDRMAGRTGTVTVAGGGYIGVEMVEAAVRRGWSTRLLTRSRVMSDLDPELSTMLAEAMGDSGVEVLGDAGVTGVRHQDGRLVAVQYEGGECATDLLVMALGLRPDTDLVRDQLPSEKVGPGGGLRPDGYGRVVPGLWAAGDCVEVWHRIREQYAYLPLGTHANKHGRALGDTLGSGRPRLRFDGAVGTAVTRFKADEVDLEVARTGLSERTAIELGLDVVGLITSGTTASGYMPEARPISAKVLAERGTRRLLGVEIVGGSGAGKRIDAAAAVLWYGGSVDDLAWMDLAYAPPVATAWEFLQVAARRVAERL